jgi:hypothetical protein
MFLILSNHQARKCQEGQWHDTVDNVNLPKLAVIIGPSQIEDMISTSTEGLRERIILGSKDDG